MMNEPLPTTKRESLAQCKSWLQSKHNCSLSELDELLQEHLGTTLKESLAENWDFWGAWLSLLGAK